MAPVVVSVEPGEGRRNLYGERLPSPLPRTSSPHFPKTFDWWGGGAEEVQKNEKKPFRQIAATPLPHYKSLRRERGVVWRGEREALLSRRFSPSKSPIPQTRA